MKGPPCTALVAASGNPEAGTAFHEFSGKIWAFRKSKAISRNAIIHYRNTNSKKLLYGNKNLLLSKYSNTPKLNNRIDSII